MKNYAGHRLSPWLGHLMVSRQETARPLLTAGEIMQLPNTDEIVLVSGCLPIRARKVRYFRDKRFQERIVPPPRPSPPAIGLAPKPATPPAKTNWTNTIAASVPETADPANSGVRREPELPKHEEIAPQPSARAREFEQIGADEETNAPEQMAFDLQAGNAIGQTPLDPADHLRM
jgi:type IV secretion system protein VirD4